MDSLDNDSISGDSSSSSTSNSSNRRRKRRGTGRYRHKLFPIRNEAFIHLLKAATIASTTAITGLSVFAATIPLSWPKDIKPVTTGWKACLISLPFVFVPCGMMVVGWAHAAEHQHSLLPVAAALVLCEFIYTVGLLTIVATFSEVLPEKVIYIISAVVLGVLLLIWSFTFEHPKILARLRDCCKWTKTASKDREGDGTHQPVSSNEPNASSGGKSGSSSSSSLDRKMRHDYTDMMFPIRKKALIHALKAISNTALAAITALQIFAASVAHLCEKDFSYMTSQKKSILLSLPFLFLPFGVLTVCFAHAAEHQRNLLPAATTLIICEFTYTFGLLATVSVFFEILEQKVACAALVVISNSFLIICHWATNHSKTTKLILELSRMLRKVQAAKAQQSAPPPPFTDALPELEESEVSNVFMAKLSATAMASAEAEASTAAAKAKAEGEMVAAKAAVATQVQRVSVVPQLQEQSADVVLDIERIAEQNC